MFAMNINKPITIIIIISSILLTACVKKAPETDAKLDELAQKYSAAFENRVEIQYGKSAKLTDIQGEVKGNSGGVTPTIHIKAGDNLTGKITIGKEKFDALYIPDSDEIISDKNAKIIEKSAKDYYKSMGIDVLEVSIRNEARTTFMLPDNIDTYRKMFKHKKVMYTYVFVKSDLSTLSLNDFDFYYAYLKDYYTNYRGNLVFVELKNPNKLPELKAFVKNSPLKLHQHNPTIYIDSKKAYIEAFDYFDLSSSIVITYNNDKKSFYYQDSDGKKVRN